MECEKNLTNGVTEITLNGSLNEAVEDTATQKHKSENANQEPKKKVPKLESPIKKSTRIKKKTTKMLDIPGTSNSGNGETKLAVIKAEQDTPDKRNKWSMISKAGRSVEFSSCLNCGLSGISRDFVEKGQFCSEHCSKLQKSIPGDFSKGGSNSHDPVKLLSGFKLGTSSSIQTSIPTGTSAPAVLCIPSCPTVPTKTGEINPSITSTPNMPPGISVINLTIANSDVLPGLSQVTKAEPNSSTTMPTSFPLLLPVGNNQSLFVQSPTIGKTLGQSMMLLKPVVTGAVSSNVMQPPISTLKGPLVTSVNTIGDSVCNPTTTATVLPKTVILPLIQSAATAQQTLSTPSGQQIQITLTPQNSKISSTPTLPSSNSVLNSLNPAIAVGPIISQCVSDSYNSKSIESRLTTKVASSTAITSKVNQVNKVSTNLVAATQAPVTSSTNLNSQLVAKPTVPEKTNSEADFAEVLEWEGGIGRLSGSDLKFKYNEFGSLEQVTDDMSDLTNKEKVSDAIDESQPVTSNFEDENLCCQNCGCFGTQSEFYDEGRFCSISCIGAYKNSQKSVKDSLKNKKVLSLKPPNISNVETKAYEPKSFAKKVKPFYWHEYLKSTSSEAAPATLFKNPYPIHKNGFKVRMKLEAIDPGHQSMFCVMTVADVLAHRVLLHFDGYPDNFDFWVNANSTEIFPVGWCDKTGHTLHPPKGHDIPFNWQFYLNLECAQAAPRHLFVHVNKDNAQITAKGFRRGVYLEAVDKKNYNLICVVSVSDTMDNRFLLHFDGWDDSYDYWVDPTSPFIHPVGWCEKNNFTLTPPNNVEVHSDFEWQEYLKQKKANPAPPRAFRPRQPVDFKVGQKLEAVDPRNPTLIRVATIKEKSGHTIKLNFDGWDDIYDFWFDDDSVDIHPINWCSRTGHTLQPPPPPPGSEDNVSGCKTHGCTGIGHFKGPKHTSHHSEYGCPYAPSNLHKDSGIQDRLGVFKEDIIISTVPFKKISIVNGVKEIPDILKEENNLSLKKCPIVGCDGSGHITGKFENHYAVSGCPLIKKEPEQQAEQPPQVKKKRGRKKKNFKDYVTGEYFNTATQNDKINCQNSSLSTLSKVNKDSLLPSATLSDSQKNNAVPDPDEQLILMMNNVHRSVFYTSSPTDVDQEFKNRWDQHVKFLPLMETEKSKHVKKWSIKQVYEFIKKLPVSDEIAKKFLDEEIDGESLLMVTQPDLIKTLNLKVGPAVIIYNSILKLQKHCDMQHEC